MNERENALRACKRFDETAFRNNWGFDLTVEWDCLPHPNLEDMNKEEIGVMIEALDNLKKDISELQTLLTKYQATL